MKPAAPRRPLSPFLFRRALTSGINLNVLARVSGWVHYPDFYTDLHSEKIIATPLRVGRLEKLARTIGFNPDEIFLDEPLKPCLVKRADLAPTNDAEATR